MLAADRFRRHDGVELAALRYAWSIPGLAVVTLGIRSSEELSGGESVRTVETSLMERGKPLVIQWGPVRGPVA